MTSKYDNTNSKAGIKIGVWILSEYKPQTGGGFSLYDRIINRIDNFNFSEGVEVCFVGHKPATAYKFKKEYICVYSFPLNNDSFAEQVSKITHKFRWIGDREGNILRKNNVDLIYYPVQGFKKVNNFPFVSANWDTGYKSSFSFPEFAMNDRFEFRDKWYSGEIFKALMVFAESESGRNELIEYTKINPERVGVVPLFPGGIVNMSVKELDQVKTLIRFKLEQRKFFFYPAQFWAHKNHYNLLKAFSLIVNDFRDIKLVLSGSDKGNLSYIKESARSMGLDTNVVFPGFISDEELFSFYKQSLALVFPSLLGPTNIPLLEARELACPVVCSDLKGHVEMMKDGAIYFDPLDHNSIYNAIRSCMESSVRNELLDKSKTYKANSFFTEENAVKTLDKYFLKLGSIRSAWGKNDKIF
jgi:glycosyltransferase involved in cell wall biosynthesis